MTGPESISNGPVSCPPNFSRLDRMPPLLGSGHRLRPVSEQRENVLFSELGWYREPFRPCWVKWFFFIVTRRNEKC